MADAFFIGDCVERACKLEVTARKAGNVHPGRDFADLHFTDFIASGPAIAPVLDQAVGQPLGRTVLEAIKATRRVVASNTNLGIVLLLTPLAAVPREQSLRQGIGAILANLTLADACDVYEAIRLAKPGGLGKVAAEDIAAAPTLPLRQIMELAADRDLVARQYVNDFQEVLDFGIPRLLEGANRLGSWENAIIYTHLSFLARFPDSLIARKCGVEEAQLACRMSQEVLDQGWPETPAGQSAFAAFDVWLSALGNTRNPGTSADLVTATLFATLREKQLPDRFPNRL